MKPRDLMKRLDHGTIEDAIARAEARTSGELRVVISREPTENPLNSAQQLFVELGMERTAARNGVLFFLAPVSQAFAVIGDQGVHEKCGGGFWDEIATAMNESFKAGDFTRGLVLGIDRAADQLARHFPRQPDDRNELPDRVVEI